MNSSGSLQAKALRQLYLTLFLRGRTSRGLVRGKEPKSLGKKLFGVLLIYALIGFSAVGAVQSDAFLTGFFLHTMGMLFTGMFIATSTGEMLFNKDEAEILGHRPINPRQLLWAKIHVLIQVSILMSLAYSLPGCLRAASAGQGGILFLVAHVVAVVVAAVFCTGMVVLLYQLCLKWFGRQKLDNLMTSAQVLLTVGLILSSQLIRPLATGSVGFSNLEGAWWIFLMPPAWFAGFDALLSGQGDAGSVVLALLGVLVTGMIASLAFGKLAETTHEDIVAAGESSGARPGKSYGRRTWIDVIAGLPPLSFFLRHPVVRASFRLCVAYMLRDRDTKLRLYPGVSSVFVMPVVFVLGGFHGRADLGLAFSSAYIGLIPLMAINLLQFSQHWQAADVFRLGPAGGPVHFIRGALMAISVVLVLPALVLMLGASVYMNGFGLSALAPVLPGLVSLPAYIFMAGASARVVPLSRPTEESRSAGRGAKMIVVMLTALIVGYSGYLAVQDRYLIVFLAAEAAVSLLICVLANLSMAKVNWDPAE